MGSTSVAAEGGVRPAGSFWAWMRALPRGVQAALAMMLLASFLLNTIGIGWGLPNGNRSWSADALQPLTPLAVGRHVLFGDRWNSGWFYFKYPVGHPMLLLGAQSPVLAAMWLSGELRRPQAKYPFGFEDPETSLARLAVVMRLVTAAMGTGVVLLAFCAAALLFSSGMAGLWAAVTVAGLYPLVFYSHTSNVDVPLLFWLALAFVAVLWSARNDSRAASVVAGMSVAMALLTKEQGIGFLAALPLVWLTAALGLRGSWTWRRPLQHAVPAVAAWTLTTALVANVVWNPSGYVNRWRFLMGTLPAEIREKYAPYQFLTRVPQDFSLAREATKLRKTLAVMANTLGPAATLLAIGGGVLCAWHGRRGLAVLLLVAAVYYAVSLRALELMQVRYALPLSYLAALLGGRVGALLQRQGFRTAYGALFVWSVAALAPGVETVRLLLQDPRYAAERWFAEGWPQHGVRAEIYQPLTYLPRFPRGWEVEKIPLPKRTREEFGRRRPDLVVLSSGGRAGLTGGYRRDWRPGEPFFSEFPPSREFFTALRSGELGYELAQTFATTTWLDIRIPSLNPTITAYRPKATP